MFELKLAFKYFRAPRQSLARFTAFVAVAGIAAGVASLIIAQALANGFSQEMRDKILGNSAHISIFSADGEIENWRLIKDELQKIENVTAITPTAFENAILNSPNATHYVLLRTENRDDGKQNDFGGETWNFELKKISIGRELAEKSNLKIGDDAEILTIQSDGSAKQTAVKIADVFQTGLYEYDATWVSVAPRDFARLRGKREFMPQILSVSVADVYKSSETAQEIKKKIGGDFRVLDWQEANRPLFAALSLERKVALAIISLIIFIAALNITTTLALLVNERRSDIAILRVCGAQTKSLLLIFLLEGSLLGLLGVIGGVGLGLLGCAAGNYFRVVSLSAEVYSLSYVPLRANSENVLLIVCVALSVCLLATIYPALRASRLKPLENLRNQ